MAVDAGVGTNGFRVRKRAITEKSRAFVPSAKAQTGISHIDRRRSGQRPRIEMAKKYAKGSAPDQLSLLKAPKATESEVEAYGFIRQQLRDLGWIVKDPSKGGNGQVWTQNQCLADPHMKLAFDKARPENVVKLSEKFLWIIEAKASRKDLNKALAEATDFYCDKINGIKGQYKALIATGVAGNEDAGYLMRTVIRLDGKWHTVTINKQEATGLLSPDDVQVLLKDGGADVHEYAPPQWLFISAAERINEILHSGGINKEQRARTMAALLLSVIDEPPNLETKLQVLIGELTLEARRN